MISSRTKRGNLASIVEHVQDTYIKLVYLIINATSKDGRPTHQNDTIQALAWSILWRDTLVSRYRTCGKCVALRRGTGTSELGEYHLHYRRWWWRWW